MAKRMTVWVACAVLLAVGGTVVASNMGFKFVPNYNQPNHVRGISIPLNHNYTNAESVLADIAASGCTVGIGAGKIERVNPGLGGGTRTSWFRGAPAPQNFPIAKSDGYMLTLPAVCTSWVLVGSHDPSFTYTFPTGGFDYFKSIPYHTTAVDANDILISIPSANKVERWEGLGGKSITSWFAGAPPAQRFPVRVGEAYMIRVLAAGTTWTPPHY